LLGDIAEAWGAGCPACHGLDQLRMQQAERLLGGEVGRGACKAGY
jgi:Zn ribbon nucleic-acid-binding protein